MLHEHVNDYLTVGYVPIALNIYDLVCLGFMEYPIYQPLRSGRIWHKVNF